MKRRINGLFIGVLLFLLCPFCNIKQNKHIVLSVSADDQQMPPISKTLYIDFSLIGFYQDDQVYSPSFIFVDEEEDGIALSKIDDGVFCTDELVPAEFFLKEEQVFKISLADGITTPWIVDRKTLSSQRYDYIYLVDNPLNKELCLGGYGHYGKLEGNPGATYATQRIWFGETEGSMDKTHYPFGAQRAVGYFDGLAEYRFFAMVSLPGTNLYYADVPYTLKSVDFLLIGKQEGHHYAIYSNAKIQKLQYGVCYFVDTNEISLEEEAISRVVAGADSNCIARVVEAYLTFGKDPSNGSLKPTVRNLYRTWMQNKKASDDELKTELILDYVGYAANGYSYIGLEKTNYYSVREKWFGLCSNAGLDPNTGEPQTLFDMSFFWDAPAMTVASIIIGIFLFVPIFFLLLRREKTA